jgi:hypothetical protein
LRQLTSALGDYMRADVERGFDQFLQKSLGCSPLVQPLSVFIE